MPKSNEFPGVILELKAEKNCTEQQLKKLAEEALAQIKEKRYDMELQMKGVESIWSYGVAFSGKHVEIILE